jgi:hypothetical protein
MATNGEKRWPRLGRNRWPLTELESRPVQCCIHEHRVAGGAAKGKERASALDAA